MRATLMHNPQAGSGEPAADELLELLRAAGYQPTYQCTKAAGYADALQDPGDLVVVAGGDGTVRKIANHLAGSGVPMAILPVGTANNIASEFGLSGSLGEMIHRWRTAARRRLRLGRVAGPAGEVTFVESVGAGFFAETMLAFDRRELSRKKTRPPDDELARVRRYLRKRLPEYPEQQWSATLDGERVSGEFIALIALNVGRLGPGVVLAPGADPGDELLRIVTIRSGDRSAVLRLLEDETAEVPAFPVRECRRLRLHPPEVLRVDGKFFSPPESFGADGDIEVWLTDRWVEVLASDR